MKKNILFCIEDNVQAYQMYNLVKDISQDFYNVQVILNNKKVKYINPLLLKELSGVGVQYANELTKNDLKNKDLLILAPITKKGVLDIYKDKNKIFNFFRDNNIPIIIAASYDYAKLKDPEYKMALNTLDDEYQLINFFNENTKEEIVDLDDIKDNIKKAFAVKDLKGKTVLVTAGPTIEDIDGISYIGNHSSGKMGISIAREAFYRGANVILVAGKVTQKIPGIFKDVSFVITTMDMKNKVIEKMKNADIIIKAAAPGDYVVANDFKDKLKQDKVTLDLKETVDIAVEVGKIKENRILVIFCAEKKDLVNRALGKLKRKNADIVIANNVEEPGAGFSVDTNIVTIINKNGNVKKLPKILKSEVAREILDEVVSIL